LIICLMMLIGQRLLPASRHPMVERTEARADERDDGV
jgi:hypothetical protein